MTIAAPKLETVSIYDLKLDAHTQRTWDPKWSKKIAKEFDEDKLGQFRVSRRANGEMYVIDGQHRLHAVRDLGWDDDECFVDALIWDGLSLEQEAELYVAYNVETRKPNTVDTFRLETVAGAREATEIQAVLNAHELIVSFGFGGNTVSAVQALRWIYRLGGVDLLDRTFTVVEKAWGTKTRESRDGNILKAVAHVLNKLSFIDQSALEDKLGKSGRPGQILGNARTYRQATKRALWLESAHQIVAIYNHGRRMQRVSL